MPEEVFEALLAPHLQRIRSFVRARLHWHDADDVVQRTLLHAFVHRNQLRCASKFRSWLWSIAWNEIRMFHRGARPEISLEERANADWAEPAIGKRSQRNIGSGQRTWRCRPAAAKKIGKEISRAA